MSDVEIHDQVWKSVEDFRLPETLGFGLVPAPVMYSAAYENGQWSRGQLLPYGPIEILPGARALHFAEQAFEGMKAYRVARPVANLFRANDNCARFRRSAERIAMCAVPDSLFLEGIRAVVGACTPLVPGKSGQSLYLRPFLFGTEPGYAVRASHTARFMVIANPSEAYAAGPMKVLIEREQVRAASGGLGAVKAGANYAASLLATTRAIQHGYAVALWLDPVTRQNIEELSGMNLFAVIGDELHTPRLNDSILPGVTRDSLIRLARDLGWRVIERPMPIAELLAQLSSGECRELFACGTAAIVCPISMVGDTDGRQYQPAAIDERARILRERLLAIQERRAPDPYGWISEVTPLARARP
ncbi:MAG TPA: branched-chain amino acid aminotransferase [Steroidobacteraceae bacterium]|nr:branched-chain amino acid aminotransferase [Steroidobacteraceae bacterium]